MEIVFMTLGILCGVMPYPFPWLIPIIIGTIRIIANAVEKEKEPPATQPIVYCNGEKEPKRKRASNAVVVQATPAKSKTALVEAYVGGNDKNKKKTTQEKTAGKKRSN